ncbi:MAG: hypothetical protein J6Q38_03100, partial [Clostridia bacterium]|nr:hypothetical protein [Clostridia bacterium]
MGMISNSKNVNFPKLTKKKITLNSFLTKGSVSLNEMLSDPAEVALLLNFDASDGTLKAGIGLSELLLDGNSISLGGNIFPVKLYYYKVFDSSLNDYDDRL